MTETTNNQVETEIVIQTDEPITHQDEQTMEESTTPSSENEVSINTDYSNGVKKRIDKLSKKLSEKDAEIERLKQELQKREMVEKQNPNAEPQLDDFETVAAYRDALKEWVKNQAIAEQNANSQIQNVYAEYNKRVAQFIKTAPDYIEALNDIGQVNPAIENFVLESDNGPAVIYHLANNIDELERINRLSNTRKIIALNEIERALTKTKSAKPIPQPITKPSGNSTPTTAVPQTYQEWKKSRTQSFKR